MATEQQIAALLGFRDSAKIAGHIWPAYAACEAALESSWGTSKLVLIANNLFGEKQRAPNEAQLFTTIQMATQEFVRGKWEWEMARWVSFPTLADCFAERMTTLKDMSHFYPDYAAALAATTGDAYVTAVSKRWSTDPQRAEKVLEIYRAHQDILGPATR